MPKEKVFRYSGVGKADFLSRMMERMMTRVNRMPQRRVREALRNEPQRFADSMAAELTVDKLGLKNAQMESMLNEVFPGHERPSEEVRARREAQRQELAVKLSNIYSRHLLVTHGLENPDRDLGRPFSMLTDTSPEGLAREERLIHVLQGRLEDDPEAIIEEFQRLGSIDLTGLDPLKPETYLERTEDVLDVMIFGAELPNLVRRVKQEVPDLLWDPRLREMLEKAEAMYELSTTLSPGLMMMCSSLYPEMGMLDNPEVTGYNPERPAEADPDYEADEDIENIKQKYIDTDYLYAKDGSAYSYLAQLDILTVFQPRLIDRTKTMEQRLREFQGTTDLLDIRPYLAENPALNNQRNPGLPEKGHLPLQNDELRARVEPYLRGPGSQRSDPPFHPGSRGDVRRLYIKLEGGNTCVPAFPEAQGKRAWDGLTEAQLRDIFFSEGKYVYFPAGSTTPQVFNNGKLEAVELSAIQFTKAGDDRVYGWPDKALADEKRTRELEIRAFDLNRVEESLTAIYGSKLTDVGSDRYRSYRQLMIYNLSRKENTVYPDLSGKLTEEEVSALSMLAVGNPDVNGGNFQMPEYDIGTATAGFSMAVNDGMIERAGTNSNYLLDWAVKGRQAMKPIFEHYASADGKPADLAETIVKGMQVLSHNCINKASMTKATISEMIPAHRTAQMLENHPELLEAVREYAARNGMAEQFEENLYLCRNAAKQYETLRAVDAAERKLLAYENGDLADGRGQPVTLTGEELESLRRDVRIGQLIRTATAEYFSHSQEYSPEAEINRLGERMQDVFKESSEAKAAQQKLDAALQKEERAKEQVLAATQALREAEQPEQAALQEARDKSNKALMDAMLETQAARREAEAHPMPAYDQNVVQLGIAAQMEYLQRRDVPLSPTMELLFSKEGGMEAVELLADSMKKLESGDLLNLMEEEGLIPKDGLPDPTFNMDEAIADFMETAPEKYNPERVKAVQEQYGALLDELGLDADDLQVLAQNKGMSIEEYARKMAEENGLAEENSPDKLYGLDRLKEDLSSEKINSLGPVDMCMNLKELNQISREDGRENLYVASQCEILLNKLYMHMLDYEKTHPEFTAEKGRYLRKQDFLDAQATIQRGVRAAQIINGKAPKEVSVQPQQKNPEKKLNDLVRGM